MGPGMITRPVWKRSSLDIFLIQYLQLIKLKYGPGWYGIMIPVGLAYMQNVSFLQSTKYGLNCVVYGI